jgi:hypothetical protein
MSMNNKVGLLCALALALAACGSNTTTDDAATIISDPDASAPTKLDGGTTATDTSTPPVADPYVWVVVQDTEQKACSTNGPGADIDAVGKMDATTNQVVAWGKHATYTPNPKGNACTNAECASGNCKYAAIGTPFTLDDLVARTEGPADATISKTADDTGYFSLNAGTLTIDLADAKTGALVPIKSGDWIVVYEVDQTYITSKAAYAGCTCLPEHYTVTLQNAAGTKTLDLIPSRIDTATNTACLVATPNQYDGCGTTVFAVP